MDDKRYLRTKAFIFSFRFNEQFVGARIQVGVSNGMQSARACPFIGETFQFVNNIVFVGRNVIGCGELYAEHGLVCIESYLFGMAQGALQDAGFVSYMDSCR